MEIIHNIRKRIKEKIGSQIVNVSVVVIVLCMLMLLMMEYTRLSKTIINIKNVIDEAVITTAVSNNYSSFHGRKQSKGFSSKRSIDNWDVETAIEEILKTDSTLSKYSNTGQKLYQILNLRSTYVNQIGENLNFTTTATVRLYINVLGGNIPIDIQIRVHSRYISKFN